MTPLTPCWPEGQTCPNNCAFQLLERTVYNKTPLHGSWAGWRMAGCCLVSPDGDRISPERLRFAIGAVLLVSAFAAYAANCRPCC